MAVDLLQRVEQSLEKFRAGFQADGADLKVEALHDAAVEVRIVVTPETCVECLLPRDKLEAMFQMTLRADIPEEPALSVRVTGVD